MLVKSTPSSSKEDPNIKEGVLPLLRVANATLQVLGGAVTTGSGVLTMKCPALAPDSAAGKVWRLVQQVSRPCILAKCR